MNDFSLPQLASVQELYESARFIDAWRLTEPLWKDRQLVQRLSADELIMAGRLAGRLGSGKYYRALMRLALERAPDSPRVRYYARAAAGRRMSLYDLFCIMEDEAPAKFEDPDLAASWYAYHATLLARYRDFGRAHDALRRAEDTGQAKSWVLSNRAWVLLLEDRFDEALAVARDAWQVTPGHPYSADALAAASAAGGRDAEFCEVMLGYFDGGGQSGQCLDILLATGYGVAKRLEPEQRGAFVDRLIAASGRHPALLPLADRQTVQAATYQRLMLAYSVRDWETMARLTPEVDAPYFKEVLANRQANPGGTRTLLTHTPVRQRHNTCLPASVATCGSGIGVEIDQDALSRAISFEGTAWWRAREWAAAQGLQTRCFFFSLDATRELITRGIPYMISFAGLNSAHACAVVGLDETCGTVLVHDPSDARLGEMLASRMGQDENPVGPHCMAFLTPAQAAALEGVSLTGEAEENVRVDFYAAMERDGPGRARAVLEALPDPTTPLARFLLAIGEALAGRSSAAVDAFSVLLSQHPQCVHIQRQLLATLENLGDNARRRATLHGIVTRAPLPGLQGSQNWIYPAPHLLGRYAEALMQDARSRDEAARWLKRAMQRGPFESEAYYRLGHLLMLEDKPEQALRPFRIASLLEYGNEPAAETYATELYMQGRSDEALAWLRARVERYKDGVGGAAPWTTLVDRLEFCGRPDEALNELRRARAARPDDGELASFAASFFMHYGARDDAMAALATVREHSMASDRHFAEMKLRITEGDLAAARECAANWLAESPRSRHAQHQVLNLTRAVEGPDAALKLAESWYREAPGNDELEEMFLEALATSPRSDERKAILRNRLKRNPHDAWAWRELGIELEGDTSRATHTGRITNLNDLQAVVAQCAAMSPEHVTTMQLQAELAHLQGDDFKARALFARCIDADPSRIGPLSRVLELCRGHDDESRRMVEAFTRSLGRVRYQRDQAPAAARTIARFFGAEFTKACIDEWEESAPGDPYLMQARVELAIARGNGIAAIEPLVPRLEETVRAFPVHVGLREALVQCYVMTLRLEDAAAQCEELVTFAPHYMAGYEMLAEIYERLEKLDRAEETLRRALRRNPLESSTHHALVSNLLGQDRLPEALDAIAGATRLVPSDMGLWERRIFLLLRANDHDAADAVSREVAALFPDGSYTQLLRARAMRELPRHSTRPEIEAQFKLAMSLNAELWDAVSEYADFLCDQAQFVAALDLLEQRRRHLGDPVDLDIKLLEVKRRRRHDVTQAAALAALLKKRPNTEYGWRLFITWAGEDQTWKLARDILPLMPPNLGEDLDLQLEKLTMLVHAGEPFDRVAEQWWQLISNHPANMAVNLRWFDMLMDQRRFEDAGSVLEIYAQHNADAPQMLCRRVALTLAEGNRTAAHEWADRLWQYKGSDGAGSIGYAFDEFKRARADTAAAKRILELHTQGWQVNRTALMFALDAVTDRAQLRKLAEDCMGTGDGALAGAALNRLNELNEQKIVVAFGGRNRDFAFAHTPVWQAVGVAYAGLEKFREAYTWLADWRKRPDAEMWAVSSCVACLLDAKQYPASLADGVYALENLEHDGSAPYMARNMLLAAFLAGDMEGFKLQYSRFSFLFERMDQSDATPYALSLCMALLECTRPKEIRNLYLQFKNLILSQSVIWSNLLDRAWRHEAGRRLGGWGRFWFNLRRFTG